MQIDQGTVGTTIQGWMSLPWFGPEHIVMPGFNSDGGSSLRSKQKGVDLFLTTCGLMAAGTRTILISRWRTGGANSLALTRNYAARLPKQTGSQALRESIAVARELELNYENEPRVRAKKSDPVLKAEHPIFWAGNMLLAIPDDAPPVAEQTEMEVKEAEKNDMETKADPEVAANADEPMAEEPKAEEPKANEQQPSQPKKDGQDQPATEPAAADKQPTEDDGTKAPAASEDLPTTENPQPPGDTGDGDGESS